VKSRDAVDVLIAGGGPGGAACAGRLRAAGLDVLVLDRATFPRDKVCAGWITPQVFEALAVEPAEYRSAGTLQPITGFRVGAIGRPRESIVRYGHPVSYGVRRCEFDDWLLRRSGARLVTGTPVTAIRRGSSGWIVNETYRAPVLVGAGGHWCPVARWLASQQVARASSTVPDAAGDVVAAQEIEAPLATLPGSNALLPGDVVLAFLPDLTGYGWCYRKGGYVNVGFGRYGSGGVRRGLSPFVAHLVTTGVLSEEPRAPWHGHAYRVSSDRRAVVGADGVLLVGDAAGLASPLSGEGIRPAVESGLLAAATIVHGGGRVTRDTVIAYEHVLTERFGAPATPRAEASVRGRGMTAFAAAALLAAPWLVRHLLLDRWFLRVRQAALAA